LLLLSLHDALPILLAHELGVPPEAEAQQVGVDQHLPVGVRARPDPDRRHRHLLGHHAGDHVGNPFEDDGEHSGGFQFLRLLDERSGGFDLPSLDPVAAHGVHGLGVRPRWPITGISAEIRASIIGTRRWPPSSFTASAPPSLTRRPALRSVSSLEMWKLSQGMSTTTSGSGSARRTAWAWRTMMSMSTPSVSSMPWTTLATES